MNDQAAPAEVAATRSSGTLNILLVVLVLMIAAMAYDKLVARPKVQKAFDLVTAANEEINASADRRAMTNKDVQEVLGRGPDSTEEVNTYMVERYGYRGGLLLKKHYYYAAYTGDEANGYKFRTHGTHEMPELQDPNFPPPRAEVADSGDHGAPPPGPPSGADGDAAEAADDANGQSDATDEAEAQQ